MLELKTLVPIPFLFGVCVVAAVPARAQSSEVLAGVDAVNVIIELDEEASQVGLTKNAVQSKTQLELRRIGIAIDSSATPFVYVRIVLMDFLEREEQYSLGWLWLLQLEFREPVVPSRTLVDFASLADANDVRATPDMIRLLSHTSSYGVTWSNLETGVAPRGSIRAVVMENLDELLTAFLNDYLAANPRQ